jgi:hypothetical protein
VQFLQHLYHPPAVQAARLDTRFYELSSQVFHYFSKPLRMFKICGHSVFQLASMRTLLISSHALGMFNTAL